MLSVELPWPHGDLSPNSRKHWSNRAKKTKIARRNACMITNGAIAKSQESWHWKERMAASALPIQISLSFIPAANRHYDLDGLISRMKSSLDGIADALSINDRRFTFGKIELLSAYKPGKVIITIASLDAG